MNSDLISEITEIHEYAACIYDHDNLRELSDRLTNLNVYLARTAFILPELNESLAMARAVASEAVPDMNATRLREYLAGKCATEQRYFDLCERLNKALVHQIEALRTQISLQKTLMQNTRGQ